jgi:putative endonuclease
VVVDNRVSIWYLYLVRTEDGRLYTGIATDVDRRLEEHRRGVGRGAKSLRGRAPLEVVYRCKIGDRATALRAEHRVKRMTKAAKERLVATAPDASALRDLLGLLHA